MKKELITSTLLALAACGTALAQTTPQDHNPQTPQAGVQAQGQGVKVDPSTQPTESMNRSVPMMKDRNAPPERKESEHPPTKAIGSQVPPMTPDAPR